MEHGRVHSFLPFALHRSNSPSPQTASGRLGKEGSSQGAEMSFSWPIHMWSSRSRADSETEEGERDKGEAGEPRTGTP